MPVPEISPPINSQDHAILVLPWLRIHCGVEIAFEYSVHEQGLLYLLPCACQKVRHIHRVLRKVMPRMHGAFEDQAKIHTIIALPHACRQDVLSHATLAHLLEGCLTIVDDCMID